MSRIDYTRQAVTLDEYRRLEPTLTRPLTDVWLRSPRLNTDARLSRLVSTPNPHTPGDSRMNYNYRLRHWTALDRPHVLRVEAGGDRDDGAGITFSVPVEEADLYKPGTAITVTVEPTA